MGYCYIAAAHAEDVDRFYQRHFNPYLNFHRPCGQPERIVDERGKEKYVYRRYATPWERCANCPALCRKQAPISNRSSASRAWTGLRLRRATPSRPGECKKPNESSFS